MKKIFFSLQYKFFIYFLVLSIVPTIIIGVFSYNSSSNVIINKTQMLNAQRMESVASNIDTILSHANEISHLIIQNQDVKEYLQGESTLTPPEVMNFLVPFIGYNSDICSIRIYGTDKQFLETGTAIDILGLSQEIQDFANKQKGMYSWRANELFSTSTKQKSIPTFSLYRLYLDKYDLSRQLGYICIDIPKDVILKSYQNVLKSEESIFFVLDQNGTVQLSSAEKYIGESFPTDQLDAFKLSKVGKVSLNNQYVVNAQSLKSIDWVVVDLTPVNVVIKDNRVISKVMITMVAINMVVCFLIALYISNKNLRPLRQLGRLINEATDQQFGTYSGGFANDEIGLVITEFNTMSAQLEKLINEVYIAKLKQGEAEFQALQEQINPHFLYNTLDTIYWVCRLENAPDASKLVQALGDMFRLSLSKGEGIISLEDEIKHLKSYLMLQEKRCKNSIHVQIRIDNTPCILQAQVIKLILQPLVENSYVHGFKETTADGSIEISISQEQENLIYRICDNGIGLSEQFIEQFMSNSPSPGFGLKNVNDRIKLLYGNNYGITLENRAAGGAQIVVIQPFLRKENADVSIDDY